MVDIWAYVLDQLRNKNPSFCNHVTQYTQYANTHWNHLFFRNENFRVRIYYMYMDIHACQSFYLNIVLSTHCCMRQTLNT